MPVLPGPDALGGLPPATSGRQILASVDTSAVGRAVANFGQQMEQGAAQLQQSWERNTALNTEADYQKFKLDQAQKFNDSVNKTTPDGAAGFTASSMAAYKADGTGFMANVPPSLKGAYTAKLLADQYGVYTAAHRFETEQQTLAATNTVNDGLNSGVLPRAGMAGSLPVNAPEDIAKKNDALKQAQADADGLVDRQVAAGLITPIQGAADKRANASKVALAFAEKLPPEERKLLAAPQATGSAADAPSAASSYLGKPVSKEDYDLLLRAVHGESDGDPTESAMIAATILNRARDSGKSIHDVLYAPNQFQAVTGTANNGHQGNSNFVAGPSGAARAKIEGAIAGILPGVDHGQNDFTAANPKAYGPGTDVGYLHKMQAAGGVVIGGTIFNTGAPKGGSSSSSSGSGGSEPVVVGGKSIVSTAPASPYNLDALKYEDRVKLAESGQAELDKAATKANADANAAATDLRDSYKFAIDTGQMNDASFVNDERLPIGMRDSLWNDFQAKNKDYIAGSGALQDMKDGKSFNPFNAEDKTRTDSGYRIAGGADGLLTEDKGAVTRLRSVVESTGIIPKTAVETLQSGIYSNEKDTRDAAFTILDGLYRSNRQAVEQALPAADVKRLQDYQALAPVLPPEELAKRLDPTTDPRSDKIQTKLREDGYKIADKVSVADIMNSGFDPSWLPGDQPNEPADPEQLQALKNDFNQAFADRYAVSGNEGVAKTQALQLLQQKWGGSSVTGSKTLMAWPPEKYYPPVGGSYDWMAAQLKTEVAQQFPDAQSYHVVATPATEAQLKVGSPPYSVIVTDKDGVLRTLTAKWDPSVPINSARADFEKQQADALAAKATQALRRAAVTGATNPLATAAGAAINGEPPLIRPAATPSQTPAPAPSPNGLPSLGGPGTVLPPRQNPMRRDPRSGGFPVRQ